MKIPKSLLASLLLGAFALSSLFLAPATITAQQSREILRLGRGTANALDWRPDGEVLAVGGGAGIWLYDENFQDLAHLYADVGQFTNVSWSPDGSRLVALTGSPENILQMWHVSDDVLRAEVLWTKTDIPTRDISWKPDGTQFATTGDDHLLRIWDAASGTIIRQIPDVGSFGIAWSPDGKWLAGTESDSDLIRIWNPDTGEIVRTLQSITQDLYWVSVAWSPDSLKLVGVSSLPSNLYVWDTTTGTLLHTSDEFEEWYILFDVLWNANTDQIITVGYGYSGVASSSIKLWDTTNWKILKRGVYPKDNFRRISLHPTGNVLTAVTWGGLFIEWDIKQGEVLREHQFFSPPIYHLAWSPDSDQIASSSYVGEGYPVEIWDLSQQNDSKVIEQPVRRFSGDVVDGLPWSYITSLTWTASDELVTTSENEPINFIFRRAEKWDANTGESRSVIFSSEGGCGAYGWNSDFSIIACTNYEGTAVEIRNAATQEILLTIPVENVRTIIWSSDDQLLAISQFNTKGEYPVELWSATTGKQVAVYDSDTARRWSPNSQMIALSTGHDNKITFQILNVQTGDIKLNLESTGAFAWSPDSHTIALSTDNSIDFYDVTTGSLIESLPAPDVSTLAWSSDGKMLALAVYDGTIRIWDMSDFV